MVTTSGAIPSEELAFFTYAGLEEFLGSLSRRWSIFPLGGWRGQPGIILRHDIDLDLAAAERVARIEATVGISASFFCMTSAETYNVCSPSGRAHLRRIHESGGEIGLHFDPTIYPNADAVAMLAAAVREASILEQVIGAEVRSVSLHNPSVTGEYPILQGWRNAYDPAIFSPKTYLSDSRMRFSADPRTFFSGADASVFQLLLHPMHYSAAGARYPAPMLAYLRDVVERVDSVFRVNSVYQETVGDNFVRHVATAAAAWR